MKCPKCKKKLQTRRTLEHDNTVGRERFCVKCKKTIDTTEMFSETWQDVMDTLKAQTETLRDNYDALYDRHNELKDAINTIIKAGQKK